MSNEQLAARHITIRGIVQGVGFRPFVYSLADKYQLTGWVRNTAGGVEIAVNGRDENLDEFINEIRSNPPALAKIDQIQVKNEQNNNYTKFEIISSQDESGQFMPVSPDVSICPDCLREIFNPADRRYRYPFINCTNCGPRFSIIRSVPYDRPNTTMSVFPMCPSCKGEYEDPRDRRFHAQPIACPNCGPQVWFESGNKVLAKGAEAIQLTRQWLKQGKIIAIKGLGGFHLSCDAQHDAVVRNLRERKHRNEKPLAVMIFDEEIARKYCDLSQAEMKQLASKEKPIILCQRSKKSTLAGSVAPNLDTVGIMLPYTPLHYLLLEPAKGFPKVLVMTSGNMSEEPIAYTNEQAREKLGGLADAFLFHDREIHTRLDDSVIEINQDHFYSIRRSRGYAPDPIVISAEMPQILATGAELKNTFCLTRSNYAFVSHHIGDLENLETYTAFESSIHYYEEIFRIKPEILACDLHPDYLSTRYAENRSNTENLSLIKVQHHHAHLAACLAENRIETNEPVIGVCFDGTGYGTDGAIWGGEFLLGNYSGFERKYHLNYIPLPGGDQAIRYPFRVALAHLWAAGLEWDKKLPPIAQNNESELDILQKQLEKNINCLPTSSMGRLFDAVASLIGIKQRVKYEAQAAIELEALLDPHETGFYQWHYQMDVIDPAPLLESIILDYRSHIPVGTISARFHNSIIQMVITIGQQIRTDTACQTVALSGGVWQNRYLVQQTEQKLKSLGFTVLLHSQIPTNDGGIALGQAMIAAHKNN